MNANRSNSILKRKNFNDQIFSNADLEKKEATPKRLTG